MKRDMELVRKLLLEIERLHISYDLTNHDLAIESYDMYTIAYHCQIMFEKGLISSYKPIEVDGGIAGFRVGGLTWDGNDFLEKIRDNSVWHKTKETIKEKGLPLLIETIKEIANGFIAAATQGAVDAIMKNGG